MGVGEHHGADVAPFHDQVAVLGIGPLAGDEHLAHLREARHARCGGIHLGRPDRTGDVVPVDHDASLLGLQLRVAGDFSHRRLVVQVHASVHGAPGDGAVHGARVHVPALQCIRDGSRHRSLARARRAIDCDQHRVTEYRTGTGHRVPGTGYRVSGCARDAGQRGDARESPKPVSAAAVPLPSVPSGASRVGRRQLRWRQLGGPQATRPAHLDG